MKELCPDMVATHGGSVGVVEGHAFVVEAAVSLGGRNVKSGMNIFRYANRIPLLFEGGSDVITRTAMKRINWNLYGINQSQDKVGVFVSLVSTKIPFKGAGKEYIADDVQEIQDAIKVALQNCCNQLKKKISRQQAAREQRQRKKNLVKYIPNVASAVFTVLQSISDRKGKARWRARASSPTSPAAPSPRSRCARCSSTTWSASTPTWPWSIRCSKGLGWARRSTCSWCPRRALGGIRLVKRRSSTTCA